MALFEFLELCLLWRSANAQRRMADQMERANDFMIYGAGPPQRIEPGFTARFSQEPGPEGPEWHMDPPFIDIEPDATFTEPTDWRLPRSPRRRFVRTGILDLKPPVAIMIAAEPRAPWWRRLGRWLAG